MRLAAFAAACAALLAFAAAQPAAQPAGAVILPSEVVNAPTSPAPAPTGTFTAVPAPPPPALAPPVGLAPAPAQAAAPPAAAAAPLGQVPAAECEDLDQLIKNKYSGFFLLTRLVNLYTLADSSSPTPPLNASYAPLTILAPDSVAFLRRSRLDPGSLAGDPLQAVLLAPTLGAHFVRGYFPASALPTAPVDTLCGAPCGPATFQPTNPVRVSFQGGASATITRPNVADCPGQWVVHEVSDSFYTQVTDPLQAAEPALNLAYALGGQWDSYNLVGPTAAGRRRA